MSDLSNSFSPFGTVRNLKCIWTRESQEDLRISHNLEAEMELSEMMAAEIRAEIDQSILHDLRQMSLLGVTKQEYFRPADWRVEGF